MSRWLHCFAPRSNPSRRLFGFPHAGGGSAVFFPWTKHFGESTEVHAAQFPGRERRRDEPFVTDFNEAAQALADAIYPLIDRPYVLYGHSLGSLMAFEVVHRLRVMGAPLPVHLFVASRRAPQVAYVGDQPIGSLPKEEFLRLLQENYGALPQAVLSNPELLDMFEPIIRSDMILLEGYQYSERGPLDCPLTVYSGVDDPSVNNDMLEAWKQHTTVGFERKHFPGDHFFVQSQLKPLLESLSKELETSAVSYK